MIENIDIVGAMLAFAIIVAAAGSGALFYAVGRRTGFERGYTAAKKPPPPGNPGRGEQSGGKLPSWEGGGDWMLANKARNRDLGGV